MDHIPRPYNAVGTPIEFPYVGVEYDKGPFLTYPNRKGFESQDAILQESDTPASQAAVLQTWLFFSGSCTSFWRRIIRMIRTGPLSMTPRRLFFAPKISR